MNRDNSYQIQLKEIEIEIKNIDEVFDERKISLKNIQDSGVSGVSGISNDDWINDKINKSINYLFNKVEEIKIDEKKQLEKKYNEIKYLYDLQNLTKDYLARTGKFFSYSEDKGDYKNYIKSLGINLDDYKITQDYEKE